MNEKDPKAKGEEKKKSDAKVILYLGEDEGYWQDLKEGLKNFKQINFEFNLHYESNPKKIQNFTKLIYDERPRVVFIDLAKNTEQMLHLLRIQSRINSPTNKPTVIALTAYKQGREVVRQAIMAGAQCVHVKSGEVDAVVYDAVCFAFHEVLEDHGFAMAKMDDVVVAYFPAKVSVLSPKGLRLESNFKIRPGEECKLRTFWKNNNIMPSSYMTSGNQESKDLYYNFDYAQELGFEYLDPLVADEDSGQKIDDTKETEEREELIAQAKKRMLDWILAEKPKSRPKTLKTLVIDKELTLYNDQPLTDSHDFVIRVQPFLVKFKQELTRYLPQMIAYNMEEIDPEELEANQDLAHMFNEGKNLQYLIKVIKSIGDYRPFVIVFNTEHETAKLQSVLKYKQILGHRDVISSELVVKMAEILRKKYFGEEDPFGENVMVLDKSSDASYAEFESAITIVGCSENDIYFNCDKELAHGTVFKLNMPAEMYVTVTEPPGKAKVGGDYYGVIHGIGEEEKKELRRHINAVFFREKEAAKAQEKEQVEATKQKFIDAQKAKEEEERKKAEEEARIAAEEEAEKEEAAKKAQENDDAAKESEDEPA